MQKRSEVARELKWDLSPLFSDREAYQGAVIKLRQDVDNFVEQYRDLPDTAEVLIAALEEFCDIYGQIARLGNYASLQMSVDQSDAERLKLAGSFSLLQGEVVAKLSAFNTSLYSIDDVLLDEVAKQDSSYQKFIEHLKLDKEHILAPEIEKVLSSLSPVTDSFIDQYEQLKLADMQFPDFTVDGKSYPLSFVLYENKYQYDPNTAVRREAFRVFSETLRKYNNGIAHNYATHVNHDKIMSKLRGFDSVFDYLLSKQYVGKDLYDRQIDLIMKELAPHMRRYAQLVKEAHGLDEMHFADLKISLDPELSPSVTYEEAWDYAKKGLAVLGEDYVNRFVKKAQDERWCDFAQNVGKSTGGFCASPYGSHSYILLNWNGLLSDVFTLVHELGHAGHFGLANTHNNILQADCSLYFVEAPSTCNEMLLNNYLYQQAKDDRFRRWVLATGIANTYFHNFVTHLLEADFQRKVYRLVDAGEMMTADTLNQLKRETLENFWGDAVTIEEGAELTWMRQPHYYMGLYSYTYSAGLTISTMVSQQILKEGQAAVDRWLAVLKRGGSLDSLELAQLAEVDVSTDQPLRDTIAHIGSMIDKIAELTAKMH